MNKIQANEDEIDRLIKEKELIEKKNQELYKLINNKRDHYPEPQQHPKRDARFQNLGENINILLNGLNKSSIKMKMQNLNEEILINNKNKNINPIKKLEEDKEILRKEIQKIVENQSKKIETEKNKVVEIAQNQILKGMKEIKKSFEQSKINSNPIENIKKRLKNLNVSIENLKISQKSQIDNFKEKFKEKFKEMKNLKEANIEKLEDQVNFYSSFDSIRKNLINNLVNKKIDQDSLKKILKNVEAERVDQNYASDLLRKDPFNIEDKNQLKNILQHIFSSDVKDYHKTFESLPSKEFKKRIIILIGYYEIPREKSPWEKLFKDAFKKLKKMNKLDESDSKHYDDHKNAKNDNMNYNKNDNKNENKNDKKNDIKDNDLDRINDELKDFFSLILEKIELNTLLENLEELANAFKGKKQIHLLNIGRVLDFHKVPVIANNELIEKLLMELKTNLEGYINFKPLEKKLKNYNYHIFIQHMDNKSSETIANLIKILNDQAIDLLSILLNLIEYIPSNNKEKEKNIIVINISQLSKELINILKAQKRDDRKTDYSFLEELLKEIQNKFSKNKIDESYIELKILEVFFDLYSLLMKKNGEIKTNSSSDNKQSNSQKDNGENKFKIPVSGNGFGNQINIIPKVKEDKKNANFPKKKDEENNKKLNDDEEDKKEAKHHEKKEEKNGNKIDHQEDKKLVDVEDEPNNNDYSQVIDYILKGLLISLGTKDRNKDFVYDKEPSSDNRSIPFINFYKSDLNIENLINLLKKLRVQKEDISLSFIDLIIEYFSEIESPKFGLINEILSGMNQFGKNFKGSDLDTFINQNSLKYVKPFKMDSSTIYRAISLSFI